LSDWPFVSVIVPTYKRPDALGRTLASILASDYPADRFEIIVVDDGSGDETRAIVESAGSNARYVQQENRGAAAARNNGAQYALGDILLFNDDDILVAPDAMRRHVTNLREFGRAFTNGRWEFEPEMLQSLEATPFGRYRIEIEEWIKTGVEREPLAAGGLSEVRDVTACSLGAWKADFWHIGGFDEQFPFAGSEDQDLSIRALNAGIRLIADSSIKLWHDDRRLTLRQFCERHRRGAISAAILARKYPVERGQRRLIVENQPWQRTDSTKLRLKKSMKALLSRGPCRGLLHLWIALLERVAPRSNALKRFYRVIIGVAIYRGINEGLLRA